MDELITAVVAVSSSALGAHVIPRVGQLLRGRARAQALEDARAQVAPILGRLPRVADAPMPSSWCILQSHLTDAKGAIFTLGTREGSAIAVLKLASTEMGNAALRRQASVLSTLQGDSRLGDWRKLIPQLLAEGSLEDRWFTVEQAVPGQPALPLPSIPDEQERMLRCALTRIEELHQSTQRAVAVDPALMDRWIDQPIAQLGTLAGSRTRPALTGDELTRLREELREAFAQRTLNLCWIHGDFWPGNILVDQTDPGRITGIIDWDMAAADELPLLDVLHLLIYTRKLRQRRELGDIIRGLLNGEGWDARERAVLDAADSLHDGLDERAAILLYWLRHVTANLNQHDSYARHRLWIAKNVVGVLHCL